MNLPPLPVSTLPLNENTITPPSLPPPPPPPPLPRRPLSSAGGDAVEEDVEGRRANEDLRLKEEWIKQMRGWLMVLAILAASVTYTAGLNPPGGFWQEDLEPSRNSSGHVAGTPVMANKNPIRYTIFVACNDGALAMSIAIIVLLLNQSIFQAELWLLLLKACVVGDMFALLMAFGAGSTRHHADIAGISLLSLLTFSYFFCWIWHFKKKTRTRRAIMSNQEMDVELGAIGQQPSQDT